MKTNEEILKEFKKYLQSKMSPRCSGATNDVFDELEFLFEQKDKEWKEKMIEVLESLDLDTSDCDERDRSVYERNLCIEEAELWQQEQINKLKND